MAEGRIQNTEYSRQNKQTRLPRPAAGKPRNDANPRQSRGLTK